MDGDRERRLRAVSTHADEANLRTTTMKSSQFQPLRRYAPGCKMTPKEMTLRNASKVNIAVNTYSEESKMRGITSEQT